MVELYSISFFQLFSIFQFFCNEHNHLYNFTLFLKISQNPNLLLSSGLATVLPSRPVTLPLSPRLQLPVRPGVPPVRCRETHSANPRAPLSPCHNRVAVHLPGVPTGSSPLLGFLGQRSSVSSPFLFHPCEISYTAPPNSSFSLFVLFTLNLLIP